MPCPLRLYFGTMYHGTTIPDLLSKLELSGTRSPSKVHSPRGSSFPRAGAAPFFSRDSRRDLDQIRRQAVARNSAPTFDAGPHAGGIPPCIRGSVFRSSQRLLPASLRAPCWALQVSLLIQRPPTRSYTASTLNT